MTVANNPDIHGTCYSDVSSLLIGKHTWHVTGDYACSSKPYTLVLALSSCDRRQVRCYLPQHLVTLLGIVNMV